MQEWLVLNLTYLGSFEFNDHFFWVDLGKPVPECLHSGFIGAKDDAGGDDDQSFACIIALVVTTTWWQPELWYMQSSNQIITTNKPTPNFLRAGCSYCHPTNSVKALKGRSDIISFILNPFLNYKFAAFLTAHLKPVLKHSKCAITRWCAVYIIRISCSVIFVLLYF